MEISNRFGEGDLQVRPTELARKRPEVQKSEENPKVENPNRENRLAQQAGREPSHLKSNDNLSLSFQNQEVKSPAIGESEKRPPAPKARERAEVPVEEVASPPPIKRAEKKEAERENAEVASTEKVNQKEKKVTEEVETKPSSEEPKRTLDLFG